MNDGKEFSQLTQTALEKIESRLIEIIPESPRSLYDPIRYALQAGGKRIRPLLTYLSSISDESANWLAAACAVELLHSFTLIHDDIMDNADTRRGRQTVHIKYNVNSAILSGDTIVALAQEVLASGKYEFGDKMMSEFASGFRAVCEGQAYDKEFETSESVTLADYRNMIDLKSAKLLELAAVLGNYSAGGKEVETIRTFTHHIGIAFQMMDDLLDLTAESASLGKMIGGDILEGKRTFLFISALEKIASLNLRDEELLIRIRDRAATVEDIPKAKDLFHSLGIIESAHTEIHTETLRANEILKQIKHESLRSALLSYSNYLLRRTY
ncbi:MAG: polyprenyl synthetase family protein [bacterium]